MLRHEKKRMVHDAIHLYQKLNLEPLWEVWLG